MQMERITFELAWMGKGHAGGGTWKTITHCPAHRSTETERGLFYAGLVPAILPALPWKHIYIFIFSIVRCSF